MLTVDRAQTSRAGGQALEYVAAVAAFLLLAVPVAFELRMPSTIDLTFVNPHEWDVGVEVVLADGDPVAVGTIDEDSAREVVDLLRLESPLRLRWTFEGEEIHTSTVSDDQLDDWGDTVTVPDAVAEQLRARRTPPSP